MGAETLSAIAIDGKTLRGTASVDQRALMLISAFDHQTACVIRQQAVPQDTNEQMAVRDLLKQLALNRARRGLENRLHWVRDESFAEDKSRIRTRYGPQQLAAVRNAVLALCRISHHSQIAAGDREFAWNSSRLFTIWAL